MKSIFTCSIPVIAGTCNISFGIIVNLKKTQNDDSISGSTGTQLVERLAGDRRDASWRLIAGGASVLYP